MVVRNEKRGYNFWRTYNKYYAIFIHMLQKKHY